MGPADATPWPEATVVSDGGDAGASCVPSAVTEDDLTPAREACSFAAGAKPSFTLRMPTAIPIKHVIVVMNENRSFDHYLGKLGEAGKADVDGWSASFTNPDKNGVKVSPEHLSSACLSSDIPHGWTAMHAQWNDGGMNGFVTSAASDAGNGHHALGYYDQTDLPFYYWLAKTFAISDRYFSSVIGPTWPNRQYLYMGSSYGNKSTSGTKITDEPTIFDALTKAGVSWRVYTDGSPRQDCIGWSKGHDGTAKYAEFVADLKASTLPQVVFLDPSGDNQDEHPPNSVYTGEQWARDVMANVVSSPLWSTTALFYTYDEAGGLADHVPPPKACLADPTQTAFDRLGFRVPIYVVSPWARPGYVSHRTHEHASIVRFIETVFDLGALTARDANSDAMLDMFDFTCPALASVPMAPEAHTGKADCK